MAVAGALSVPMAAQAADVQISGFADIIMTASDEASDVAGPPAYNPVDTSFSVPEVEIDIQSGGFRVDIDNSNAGVVMVEQANFTTELANGWSLIGGTMNSMLTADAQDAPDMQMTNNSMTFSALGGAVNLSGLAVAGMAGPANVTVGYVNDPTNNGTTDHENSVLLVVSGSAMPGLDLELGYLTQDKGNGALLDINGMYTLDALTIGVDYLSADSTANLNNLDNVYSVIFGYDLGNGINLKARTGKATADTTLDNEVAVTSIYASYAMSDSVSVALESAKTTPTVNGVDGADTTLTTIEFVATF